MSEAAFPGRKFHQPERRLTILALQHPRHLLDHEPLGKQPVKLPRELRQLPHSKSSHPLYLTSVVAVYLKLFTMLLCKRTSAETHVLQGLKW